MRIKGMIKAIGAGIAAGGADVTQILKIEVFEDDWKNLRDFMQKPLEITLEASQMTFGESKAGSHDTTATNGKRGRKKKDLVTV